MDTIATHVLKDRLEDKRTDETICLSSNWYQHFNYIQRSDDSVSILVSILDVGPT
jgi:hypothetical protein